MDTAALLLAAVENNSQAVRNEIEFYRREIRHLGILRRDHEELFTKLSEESQHDTTTQARRDSISRIQARIRRDIVSIENLIELHKESIQIIEEKQRRIQAEIENLVEHFLYRRHVA